MNAPQAILQCGDCRSHLGLVHVFVKELGEDRFIVKNQYTGENTEVKVDPDKNALFQAMSIFSERPESCPFFRYDMMVTKGFCTVHLTRPEICRDYGCWKLLFLTPDGKRAGRIMGQRHLASEDPDLTRLFKENVNSIIEPDDAVWDAKVIRLLKKAGYTVLT